MKNDLVQKLALRCGGTVAQLQENTEIDGGRRVLFIIDLNDPKANYRLLTEGDLNALPETERETCRRTGMSPFTNMKLIVYRKADGETGFRLLHGMASRMVKEMAELCQTGAFNDM